MHIRLVLCVIIIVINFSDSTHLNLPFRIDILADFLYVLLHRPCKVVTFYKFGHLEHSPPREFPCHSEVDDLLLIHRTKRRRFDPSSGQSFLSVLFLNILPSPNVRQPFSFIVFSVLGLPVPRQFRLLRSASGSELFVRRRLREDRKRSLRVQNSARGSVPGLLSARGNVRPH